MTELHAPESVSADDLTLLFQPEGLCSRCNESEVKHSYWFDHLLPDGGVEKVELGFCGDDCLVKFLVGIKEAKLMG